MKKQVSLGVLGWLFLLAVPGWASEPDESLAEAITVTQRAGGRIGRENNSPTNPVISIRFGCHSSATDADLAHLKNFPDLQELVIVGEKVTDKGLESLQTLSKLKSLIVNCSPITDQGLKHIKGMTSLKKVLFRYTNVTEEGIADLAKALPEAKITHKPLP